MRLAQILVILFILGAGPALADDYVVQIGAFERPHGEYAERAATLGTVATRETGSGLTLLLVGPYGDRREALAALGRLQAAGYTDAFVRTSRGAAPGLPAVGAGPPRRVQDTLGRLPAEVRAKVVYLDDVLHVKEGDDFIPLDEYEGGRYR